MGGGIGRRAASRSLTPCQGWVQHLHQSHQLPPPSPGSHSSAGRGPPAPPPPYPGVSACFVQGARAGHQIRGGRETPALRPPQGDSRDSAVGTLVSVPSLNPEGGNWLPTAGWGAAAVAANTVSAVNSSAVTHPLLPPRLGASCCTHGSRANPPQREDSHPAGLLPVPSERCPHQRVSETRVTGALPHQNRSCPELGRAEVGTCGGGARSLSPPVPPDAGRVCLHLGESVFSWLRWPRGFLFIN